MTAEWKQALWGTLAVRHKKEGELETTSLEFEYLHHKSRCEMLIGGATISNDVITLAACRVNVCLQIFFQIFPLLLGIFKLYILSLRIN